MPFYLFIWSDQVEEHQAAHGVPPDEFEEVVCDPEEVAHSRSSGRAIAFGETPTGNYPAFAHEPLDETTVLPTTA